MVNRLSVPQADDVIKIIDIPLAVANGSSTTATAAKRYSFDRRQALYYFEAAQILGFVVRKKRGYILSPLGRKYLALGYPERKLLLIRKMLSLHIVATVIVELFLSPKHSLSHHEMEKLISAQVGLSGTTIKRRVRTIVSWFTWLGQETRAFKVSSTTIMLNLKV